MAHHVQPRPLSRQALLGQFVAAQECRQQGLPLAPGLFVRLFDCATDAMMVTRRAPALPPGLPRIQFANALQRGDAAGPIRRGLFFFHCSSPRSRASSSSARVVAKFLSAVCVPRRAPGPAADERRRGVGQRLQRPRHEFFEPARTGAFAASSRAAARLNSSTRRSRPNPGTAANAGGRIRGSRIRFLDPLRALLAASPGATSGTDPGFVRRLPRPHRSWCVSQRKQRRRGQLGEVQIARGARFCKLVERIVRTQGQHPPFELGPGVAQFVVGGANFGKPFRCAGPEGSERCQRP